MNKRNDTIFALATPIGKSAIAVIRISGQHAFEAINKISSNMPSKANIATLNILINDENIPIDQTITTIYKSPHSYSGEDMVELSIHGGSATISKIIKTLNSFKNLRLAEPGEFTRRAFENNKLDLTQVEAISDLINSETEAQRKQALKQLNGLFSNKIKIWTNKILKILADIEAVIDFSDEDLPKDIIRNVKEQIRNIVAEIKLFLSDNNIGEKIRSGFLIAILGKTNVGKSSFINSVAKRDIAIVTDIPGTTTDAIELFTDFRGLPVKFIDTAGIRKTSNKVEILGVEKSYKTSNIADINLIFIDSIKCIEDFKKFPNQVFVQSMIDIKKKIYSKKHKIYHISSLTGEGIDKLFDRIYKKISTTINITDANVSRERHRDILVKTIKYLNLSLTPKNVDLFCEDIRLSLNEISKISGKIDVEDVLDIIFNDFCIGK